MNFLLWSLVLFRMFNAICLQTSFDPDEFWQVLEGIRLCRRFRFCRVLIRCARFLLVAHRLVFGFGYLTWEWDPNVALRSFVHPAVFAIWFSVLRLLSVDTTTIIVTSREFVV